jgi:hypothetical protein
VNLRHRIDPYCTFKDDRERRLALRSRDIRKAFVALAFAVALVVSHAWEWLPKMLGQAVAAALIAREAWSGAGAPPQTGRRNETAAPTRGAASGPNQVS